MTDLTGDKMNKLLILLILGLSIGCRDSNVVEKPSRFDIEQLNFGTSTYLVTDTKTGREYLMNYHGGFIEVAPSPESTHF